MKKQHVAPLQLNLIQSPKIKKKSVMKYEMSKIAFHHERDYFCLVTLIFASKQKTLQILIDYKVTTIILIIIYIL